jgi:hypothetical protein
MMIHIVQVNMERMELRGCRPPILNMKVENQNVQAPDEKSLPIDN